MGQVFAFGRRSLYKIHIGEFLGLKAAIKGTHLEVYKSSVFHFVDLIS